MCQMKLLPAMLASEMGKGYILPFLIQFPNNTPGKVAEDCPGPWAPAPMWEAKRKLLAPGFIVDHSQPL